MSGAVQHRSLLRVLRQGDLCSRCAAQALGTRAFNKRRKLDFSTTAYYRDEPWRQHVVGALNERPEDVRVLQHTNPTKKDGILRSELYAEEPTFMPINLDPLPKLEGSETLASTRPPEFVAAKREPTDSTFSYLLRIGKTYYAFYKTGIKNLLANRKEANAIKAYIYPFTLGGVARFGGNMYTNKQNNSVPIPQISRRDFQLLHRTKADLRKLVPFSLLLLVCGEFTPIALLVLGRRVVPRVCYLPFQQREEMETMAKRFKTWKKEMNKLTEVSRIEKPLNRFDFSPRGGRLEHPWRRDLLFAYLVGQSNFYRLPFPITRGLYWHFILRSRLNYFWEDVFCDTILIRREGGFQDMSPQDVYEFARSYGCLTLYSIVEREVDKKNYDFINEDLKAKLVPILEQETKIILDDDFSKLTPRLHWARAYRDSARWAQTPDVQEAEKLAQEFERVDKRKALATLLAAPKKHT